ncbi:MAG: tRNA dihydrouridine synthase DusB [Clostridia bacterium]
MNFEKNAVQKGGEAIEDNEIRKLFQKHIHSIVLNGQKTSLKIDNNVWLAPLAGVTDLAFRLICKECGRILANEPSAAPGLVFTEMISAKGVHYKSSNTIRLAATDAREKPVSIQIFGSEPEIMAESACAFRNLGAEAIDINMGCPMQKITANGEGSALLKNPALIEKIVSAVSKEAGLPVTVKIRRGYEMEKESCVLAALAAEAGGAAAITVHGRFRDEYYTGSCNLQAIAKVKRAVKIPVIGNGDISSAGAALRMFEETGCDGIMIGRAALGRPWIFYQLLRANSLKQISLSEIRKMIKLHVAYAVAYKGEEIGIREMRKHLAWYTKGFRCAAAARDRIFKAETAEEILTLIDDFFIDAADDRY